MSLPTKKEMLQRVKKKATSNCNDDPLAFAIGIRNGFLMVMTKQMLHETVGFKWGRNT